jgi:hypothetical protein
MMPELQLNLTNVSFDELGRVKITEPSLVTEISNILMDASTVACSSNTGCGNSANTGCGNSANNNCGESATLFRRDDVTILPDELLIHNYDFNKAILKAKLNQNVIMDLALNKVN